MSCQAAGHRGPVQGSQGHREGDLQRVFRDAAGHWQSAEGPGSEPVRCSWTRAACGGPRVRASQMQLGTGDLQMASRGEGHTLPLLCHRPLPSKSRCPACPHALTGPHKAPQDLATIYGHATSEVAGGESAALTPTSGLTPSFQPLTTWLRGVTKSARPWHPCLCPSGHEGRCVKDSRGARCQVPQWGLVRTLSKPQLRMCVCCTFPLCEGP